MRPGALVTQPPGDIRLGAVAVLPGAFPGTAWDASVAQGERVTRGQVLCTLRPHPSIALVASVAGRVDAVVHGSRRHLERIEIEAADGDDSAAVVTLDAEPARHNDAALRALLQQSGDWAAFRTRPFGRMPMPDAIPSAIFVGATDSQPGALDPARAVDGQGDDLRRGLEALLRLTAGPVFVCQGPGAALVDPGPRLRVARFAGAHPAGTLGPQIHRLWPVSRNRAVWQISIQDVAAIGALLANGQPQTWRLFSVLGHPRRAPLGARLADLAGFPAPQLISGSLLSGHEAAFLGRHDLQVSVGLEQSVPRWLRWIDRLSGAGAGGKPGEKIGAILPSEAFESLFPFAIPPVPLMRALAIADLETAERLGALELLEEDLALLSWRCASGADYGQLLRDALDRLHDEGAP